MSSEKLQKWALVAEIVAGIAVVISLAVVAYELRQSTNQERLNTAALEISTYQDLNRSIADLSTLVIEDSEFADIFIKGMRNPNALTESERIRYTMYSINVFRHGDMAYFQFEQGAIDESRLNSVLNIVTTRINSSPLAKQHWENWKRGEVLASAYTEHIDSLISDRNTD